MFNPVVTAGPEFTLIYVVQDGDTLYDIAEAYATTVDSLREANNIPDDSWIKLGQELMIPLSNKDDINLDRKWDYSFNNSSEQVFEGLLDVGSRYSVRINPARSLPEVNIPESKIIKYHIGMGDTLYDLAHAFNTSIGVIMVLNDMQSSTIRAGDTLRLPINNLSPRQVLARVIKQVDIDLLARAIHGEARGEPFIGQVAVGAVIINRVLSSYFPDSFQDVIYQSGQFSAVDDGQINLKPNNTSYRAAREAIKGTDPTLGSLYYYNPRTAKNQWWFSTRRMMVTIGGHVFAK